MLGTSGMVTSAMSGGPGVEAHTTLSAARCRARVHRLQYFCRRRIWAAGVEGRFRGIFQAELDHFRRARPAQLRDKGQHEIDARRDAAPGQDVAVPDDAALIHDGTEDRKQLPPCPVGRARGGAGRGARRKPSPAVTPPPDRMLPSLTMRPSSTMAPKTGSNSRHAQWQAARRPRRKPAAPKMSDPVHTEVR